MSAGRCGYAAAAGFSVTVVDDRPEFAQSVPRARRVVCEPFDRTHGSVALHAGSYVVIATRGHRHDESVLEASVGFGPKYIGMIGSRRKVALTFNRLEKAGVGKNLLAGVHAPIGLPIGARTAEEIGISIVAELISIRRSARPSSPRRRRS